MPRPRDFDKKEIVLKAMDLFWTRGYVDTSIQDLVDHLELGRGSLYNAFGSKQGLFLETLEEYSAMRLRALKKAARETSAREAIRHFLYSVVEDFATDPDHKGCLFVNTRTLRSSEDEEISRIINGNEKELIRILEEILNTGVKSGELTLRKDVHSVALFISNTMKGINVLSKSDYTKESLRSIVDTAMLILD